MGRFWVTKKLVLTAALALVTPLAAFADEDQMSVAFKETGPVQKIVRRTRAPEIITLRGEARIHREMAKRDERLDRKINGTLASKRTGDRAPASQQIAKK